MEHLNNLDKVDKDKKYYCLGSCGTLALETPIICPQCSRYGVCTKDRETCYHIEDLDRKNALQVCMKCDDCISEKTIKIVKHE